MDKQPEDDVQALYSDQYALANSIPSLIVGTLSNILTLFVLHRPLFKNKSFAVFLQALAFADTGVIWLGMRTIQIFNLGRTTMKMEWEYRVQIGFFALYSLASSWTVVLVTIERVIIVYKPEKAKVLCTKTKAIWAVFLTWVIFGISSLIFATTSSIENILTDSYVKYVPFVIFYSILPTLVILPCNICVIIRLYKARAARQRLLPGAVYKNTLPTDKVTAMLVTNSFVFVFMTSFEMVVLMINITTAVPLIVLQLAPAIMKANHAINFLLYCVSGATFRKELKLMFHSLCYKGQRLPEPLPSPRVDTLSGRMYTPAFAFGPHTRGDEEHPSNVKQSTRL